MRIPYWPGHKLTIGGTIGPDVVGLTMNGRDIREVKRLVSWPGFALIVARYEPRKVKR